MIKRTRSGYPRLASVDDPVQLEAYFGLEHATDKEQAALEEFRDPDSRAAFLLAVRCLAHLGYLPELETVPEPIRTYVSQQVGGTLPVDYFRERRARRTLVLKAVRTALNIDRWGPERQEEVAQLMRSLALDYPREADLVGTVVDRLREWRIELPAEQTLVTMAERALSQVETETYSGGHAQSG